MNEPDLIEQNKIAWLLGVYDKLSVSGMTKVKS